MKTMNAEKISKEEKKRVIYENKDKKKADSIEVEDERNEWKILTYEILLCKFSGKRKRTKCQENLIYSWS